MKTPHTAMTPFRKDIARAAIVGIAFATGIFLMMIVFF